MSEHAAPPPTPIESWEVLDLLTDLVQKSLVVYEEDEQGQGRYRLLETVRQYARDRLLEAGEGEAVRERHGECFLQLAEAACVAAGQGQGTEAFERLEGEHDNLRATLAWSEGPAAERTLRLAGALGEFWYERGYWVEGRQWLERALAGAPSAGPTPERARALAAAGRIAGYQGYVLAWNWLEESVALRRGLGDTRGLIASLSYLHQPLRWSGPAAARMTAEEAVALARNLGDPRLLAMALSELAITLFDLYGEFDTACLLQEESLALARRVGDHGLMAQALERLGRFSVALGDWAKAGELLAESEELARAGKDKHRLVWVLHSLAPVLSQQGDYERARSLWEEQLLLARELRIPGLVGEAIASRVAHASTYEEALQMAERAAGEYGLDVGGWALGALVARAPSYEAALQRIDQGAREYGPGAVIHALGVLGNAARERGDYDWAATCYRRSLSLRQEVGDTLAIVQSLEEFAGLAARQQQWERAATLLGAPEGHLGGGPRRANAVRACRREASAALSEDTFAAAWAKGWVLSLEHAVRYALEEADV